MKGFLIFYGIWVTVCIICLILVEEADNYFSKEWKIKDIVQAIALFPITIIIILVHGIFWLIEKFEETKLMQGIFKILNKPIRNKKENSNGK